VIGILEGLKGDLEDKASQLLDRMVLGPCHVQSLNAIAVSMTVWAIHGVIMTRVETSCHPKTARILADTLPVCQG
jgi:hypothetical protein